MPAVVAKIKAAVERSSTLLLSTPNLNFLVNSLSDPDFRESLFESDLCPPDGMPIVWIARLFGLPITTRISGSDIFEAMKVRDTHSRPLKVFLFGGRDGVAYAAGRALNSTPGGLISVGAMCPGFGSVDDLSEADIIGSINSSNADFLAVSLGAKKGQLWLQKNHRRLTIPVRTHLGATLSFQAGTISRAPPLMRTCGLEWLWRIKEEPYLWGRYWNDGCVLVRLLLSRVLLLAIANRYYRLGCRWRPQDLFIKTDKLADSIVISLRGPATTEHIGKAVSCFANVTSMTAKIVTVDISKTHFIDARFFGLLLMLRKRFKEQGTKLSFTGVSRSIERLFERNGVRFLLAADHGACFQSQACKTDLADRPG
jgi:N-acetylglucosaminyldiphosphoundecaprenol N-acetyl-beta-D-mannosaminyltransferase